MAVIVCICVKRSPWALTNWSILGSLPTGWRLEVLAHSARSPHWVQPLARECPPPRVQDAVSFCSWPLMICSLDPVAVRDRPLVPSSHIAERSYSTRKLPEAFFFTLHQVLELCSGPSLCLKRHHAVIELSQHRCQSWWIESLHFFAEVGWHAGEFVKYPTRQASWQDHPVLLIVPPVRIGHPRKVLPPVRPVLVAAGRKPVRTYRPESEHTLLSVEGICRRHRSLCHQLTISVVHRHCNRIV